jgi:hypothetical protein
MPELVQEPILEVSSRGVENALADRYAELLKIAPAGDQPTLENLLEQVRDFSLENL